jgi:hypothetical protein
MLSLLMKTRIFSALLLVLACSHLSAEPAPYYQW